MAYSYNKETWKPTDDFTEVTANKWEQGIADAIDGVNEVNNDLTEYKNDGYLPKNLYNPTNLEQGTLSSGIPTYNLARVRSKDFVALKKGTYTLSAKASFNVDIDVYKYDANKANPNEVGWGSPSNTFTMDADGYIKIILRNKDNTSANVTPDMFNSIQLELGETVTSFVEYCPPNTEITTINASLDDYNLTNKYNGCKQGYYDVSSGAFNQRDGYICSYDKVNCVANKPLKFVIDAKPAEVVVIFFNGTTKVSNVTVTLTDGKGLTTVPATATNLLWYFAKSGATPSNVGHIGVYINNEIDEVKAALGFSKTVVKEYEITVNANSVGQVNLDSTQKNNLFAVANIWYNGTDGFVNVEPSVIYVKNVTNAQKVFKLKVMAFF